MAKRQSTAFGAAAGFILSSILSILAGIAGVVLCFFDWFAIKVPFAKETFSVLDFHNVVSAVKEYFPDSPEVNRLSMIALGVIVLVVLLAILQIFYIFLVVSGKRGTRFVGILAGVLTIALAVTLIATVLLCNAEMNQNLSVLVDIDMNKFLTFTPFPFLTALCGLVEVIMAR